MHIYMDESGNTGINLYDQNQTFFYLLAVVSKWDIDKLFSNRHKLILELIGQNEMHGSALGQNRIDTIAPIIIKILKHTGSKIILCKSEKLFYPAVILFDSIYDPDQNPMANQNIYLNNRARHTVFSKFLEITPASTLHSFWQGCIQPTDQIEKEQNIIDICSRLVEHIQMHSRDDELAQIIKHNISAINHEQCSFQICQQGHNTALGLSPNTTSLGTILSLACEVARKKQRTIFKISHDEQTQFGPFLESIFNIGQNYPAAPTEEYLLPDMNIDTRELQTAKYHMKNSCDCFGIQISDVILWSLRRLHERNEQSRLTKHIKHHTIQSNFGYSQYGIAPPHETP